MTFTKIVATVGPSSQNESTLRAMFAAGVDVFRLNCSHLQTGDIDGVVQLIRASAPGAGILVDIQGPKLRTGTRQLHFVDGERFVLEPSDLSFDPITIGVQAGDEILLGDGNFRLRTLSLSASGVTVEVLEGGVCEPRRGVNLPDTEMLFSGESIFSTKDKADIVAAREAGADWLALSFIGNAAEVHEARELAGDMQLIAKIERRQAMENLEEIGAAADGLMAARGDLGVELPFQMIPIAQKKIADWGIRTGKATICATEMLESMRSSRRPTRAEVSDVANAVVQGYGAVMLSAETATGNDPTHVVSTMRAICTENELNDGNKTYADLHPELSAVAASASALAARTNVRWLLALTYTGYSAVIISACRPPVGILAATPSLKVARRLRMYRGVRAIVVDRNPDMEIAVRDAVSAAQRLGYLENGDKIVISASRAHPNTPSDTVWLYQVETE
jgi:pyruvate kinase